MSVNAALAIERRGGRAEDPSCSFVLLGSRDTGAAIALNVVEDGVGVKALEQDKGDAERNERQKCDEPAHMRHRQGRQARTRGFRQ